jgi:hypothetical protein
LAEKSRDPFAFLFLESLRDSSTHSGPEGWSE